MLAYGLEQISDCQYFPNSRDISSNSYTVPLAGEFLPPLRPPLSHDRLILAEHVDSELVLGHSYRMVCNILPVQTMGTSPIPLSKICISIIIEKICRKHFNQRYTFYYDIDERSGIKPG